MRKVAGEPAYAAALADCELRLRRLTEEIGFRPEDYPLPEER